MKRGRIASLLGAVAVAGFSLAAYAEVKENPYQVIIDRNPFGLRPIPPPPEPKKEEPPPPPAPDIKLTGITTLLGTPRVMLQVEDKQAKDPSKKFSFPTIAEGDSDPGTGIAVLSIDAENMRVRIKNGDAETTLDFKNNGLKPGGGAMASAAPVQHPGIVPPMATPLGIPPPIMPNAPVNPTTGRGIIGGASQPTAGLPGALPGALGGLPPRPLRTDGLSLVAGGGGQVYNPNPVVPITAQPTMTREEAEARIEAQRRILQQQQATGGQVPFSPNILPPTSIGRALGSPTP